MLQNSHVSGRLPAQDLARARRFYAEKLGLQPTEERPGGLRYQCTSGWFALFQSSGQPSGTHTQFAFEVDDIETVVRELRRRGVVFEAYDAPGLKTVDGIATVPGNYPSKGGAGERGAWFKDSEGNLLGIGQALSAKGRGGYADVNGIKMYYETYGPERGVPLVLLHGGGSTIDVTFGRILPFLARARRVIALEEQAHGRTSDRDAPVRFETSADDVAALLKQLQIEQADLFGFSNGASVALQVAIRHPQAVRKLVFASSFTKRQGAQPQLWQLIQSADLANMPQPLKDAFLKVNPDPAKLKTMHDKDAERMRHFTDVPDADVRAIRAPTLIVLGDHDIVKPEHAFELTHLIPNARLMVLVGGHGEYLGEAIMTQRATRAPELTAGFVEEFLDGP